MNMKTTAILLGLATQMAFGAGTILYTPTRTTSDQGIALKSWGSGTVSETDEVVFEGTKSIRISSRNYFQGGRVILNQSKALANEFESADNLLLIQFRAAGTGTMNGGAGGGRVGDGGAGDMGGPGLPGGAGGGNLGRGGRGGGAGAGAAAAPATLKRVRLVVTTSDGLKSEIYVDVPRGSDAAWKPLGVPLKAISGFGRTNKEIVEIAMSGDAVSSFYLGDIRVSNDSSPVSGDLNHSELNLALNDEIEFIANGYGGATPLKYTWDFDKTDGIQVDAEGSSIKRRFRKPGKFTVTVTIQDLYGLKKAYTRTCEVTVNP